MASAGSSFSSSAAVPADSGGSGTPSRSASSPAMPESPPEQVSTARPAPGLTRARGSAIALASSSSSCGSPAQAAPASSTRARKTRWSPATAAVWAAAAAAPASEEPTFSTATPMPASPHAASASASRGPSPSPSRNIATERTSSAPARALSQSLASITAWLPVETTVWKRRPRRVPSALTATLPLWEIIATGPGSNGSTASPHIGALAPTAMMPLPLGPHSGRSCRSAASRSSSWSRLPCSISAKPAEITIAPPQPLAPACSTASGTPGAGIATTTASAGSGSSASEGKQARPCTSSRFGLTPQTSPANPLSSRFRRTRSA